MASVVAVAVGAAEAAVVLSSVEEASAEEASAEAEAGSRKNPPRGGREGLT